MRKPNGSFHVRDLSMPQGRVAVHCMLRKHLTRVPIVSQIYSQDQHIYQHLVILNRVQTILHERQKLEVPQV